jgi:hypothetical protein
MESRMLPLSLGHFMIDENVKIKCTKMLAGIPRAGAENPQWAPDELPALQSAD